MHQLLFTIYRGSPFHALKDAGFYQERPWLTGHTPNGYWQGPTGRMHAIAAVRWLIEDQLRLTMDEIPIKVRFRDFKEHGLPTMIKSVFSGSPFLAIDAAYPGQFERWQFASVGNGYWTGENGLQHAKEAMDWLIHERLNIPVHEIPGLIGEEILKKHGLVGMLTQLFNRSVTKALDVLYPGQFTTHD
ncbi:hypothetical protein JZ785_03120 [Alicyclobacillus curvatus]|nr:hypothetical protein JZ785_03120 [Alicyclobacillus curvatus]